MKKFLLKSLFLLCALVVGSMNGWATPTEKISWSRSGTTDTYTSGYTFSAVAESKSGYYQDGSGTVRSLTLYHTSTALFSSAPSAITITAKLGGGTTKDPLENDVYACFVDKTGSDIDGTAVTLTTKITSTTGSDFSVSMPTAKATQAYGVKIYHTKESGYNVRYYNFSLSYETTSDPSSSVAFAYSSRSLDLKDATSFTQTATTADGYSSEAGASVTYSMTANTAGATIDENTGEVTPTQAGSVTVKADAAAIAGKFSASSATYTLTVTDTRVFTVTYHTGNTSDNVDRNSGATLNLDNPATLCGMSFVGWSSTNNAANPTWVPNTTKVTGDMELYAIYQAVEGQYSYRLVESSLADWRGDYLIAYSSEIFADGRVGGTDGLGKQNTAVDPETNLSGKVVDATWGDIYNITIEALDDNKLSDGYVLKTKDGKYNYYTSNNNGLTATDNKTTASAYPISVTFTSSSDVKLCLGGAAAGAVFRYNTGGYFRFYKNGAQSAVYLYKRTEDVSPIYSLGITEEITIGASKYATYCSTQALSFATTDVKAYKAKVTDNKVVLTKVDAVPANEGVILFCDVAGDYDIPVIPAADAVTENELIGVNTKTKIAYDGAGSKKNYILANGASGVGFYKASTTGANLAAHKAYLSTENAVTAREFLGFGEETTGVSDVRGKIEDGICDFFDLQGRKVAQPTKGLYIVNGKKVIIK